VPTGKIIFVTQSIAKRHMASFWPLQIGGWGLYGIAIAASSIPFRHLQDYVVYRSTFLLSGFLESFVMYALCHALWQKRVPLFRALVPCIALSYLLGTICSAASVWAEIHLGGSTMPFRWSSVFAGATGGSFVLIAWSAFYFGTKHHQKSEEQRLQLMASESLAREAQLQALRYQLQPHFLFNTLNAISTLVLDNQPRAATQMIARLADLLRSTLDSPDIHQVPLADEITVTEEYLAIEKVRFGVRLSVSFEVDPETKDAQVPRFLLQPLVENAIRHGIARRPQGGQVSIRATMRGNSLFMQVENEGVEEHYPAVASITARNQGLGLTNTRTRLQQIYGSAARMDTVAGPDGSYVVSLSMPFSIYEQQDVSRGQ